MRILKLKNAEKAKKEITKKQQKEIEKLYIDWAKDIDKKAKLYAKKNTKKALMNERYYKELKKQLEITSKQVTREIERKIKANMFFVSHAVVKDNVEWLKSLGFKGEMLNMAFSYVPNAIVQKIVTGQIYESGWSLSKKLWGDNDKTLKDIYGIVAQGVAEQKSTYEIAKNLEKYVNPKKRLPWNFTMKDGRKVYKRKIDYVAQRLARTLTQHSYQQALEETTKDNPFITQYRWVANGSRVCKLCLERNGQLFKKGELPLDHPNGMCIIAPVVSDTMGQDLANWVNAEEGTYPEIDAFSKQIELLRWKYHNKK